MSHNDVLVPKGAEKWGRRVEVNALSLMTGENKMSPEDIIRKRLLGDACYAPSRAVLYRWRKHYEAWGEPRCDTVERLKAMKKRWRKGATTPSVVAKLKEIVDENPELYIDEMQTRIQAAFGYAPSLSTISRILNRRLNYSLRVIDEVARQRDVVKRDRFRQQLAMYDLPELFLWVDETHKDRKAARRRRAWAPRGKDNCVSRIFDDGQGVRYSLLAAADINGMVEPACDLVERRVSAEDDDPERGTVDADRFVQWVEYYLCPVLGDFSKLEPRSVVIMDNATTHQDPRVEALIAARGARLLYTAPYSPDLNVIERCFHQYKAALKRLEALARSMPALANTIALRSITRDNMINYYRSMQCIRNVPMTSQELRQQQEQEAIAVVVAAAAAGAGLAVAAVVAKRRRLA